MEPGTVVVVVEVVVDVVVVEVVVVLLEVDVVVVSIVVAGMVVSADVGNTTASLVATDTSVVCESSSVSGSTKIALRPTSTIKPATA
jgi:hypothetical protein